MSIPPGTMACVRSRLCWRWRWCRWSWCSRRRSSGLCCARRCLKPTQRWSRGPSSPDRKRCREDTVRACRVVLVLRGNYCSPDFVLASFLNVLLMSVSRGVNRFCVQCADIAVQRRKDQHQQQ